METTRIGMIGAGTHATNILYPSLNYLDNIERVAVCDLKRDLAKETARNYGFRHYYTNYKKMLIKEKIEGVIVVVNAQVHPQVAIDCLKAGVDVFIEKPAARTLEEATEMLKVSENTEKLLMVDHQKRYSAAYEKALEIASNKAEFGDIVMIESKMHSHTYQNTFTGLMEWQIHNIDIIQAFGGDRKIKSVKAAQKKISENKTAIAILLQFDNGVVATVNWGVVGSRGVYCERLEVVGDKGRGVIVENARRLTYYHQNEGRVWEADWCPQRHNQSFVFDGYVPALQHFTDCIHTRTQPVPNIRHEVKALEIIYGVADQLNIPKEWSVVRGER